MREATIFKGLSAVERARLRELTTLFLHRKAINGAHGLAVTTEMAIAVAAQACLLILNLGIDSYDGWVEVVIYPGAFRVERDSTDSMGLVTRQSRVLSGESWLRGPVILSWDDVASGLAASSGQNVVVHEFAHKLDMLDGSQLKYVYFPTTAIVSLHYETESGASSEIAGVGNEGVLGISLFMGGNTTTGRAIVSTGGYAYRLKARVLMEEYNRVGGRRAGAMQHMLLRYTQALITQVS